jgi:uncharacterized membrane protein YkvA (DUF1232 family)
MDNQPQSKLDILKTLYVSIIDKRTPWIAKLLPIIALIYIVTPIDLLPDFLPFPGLIDDLIITPLLLWLSIRMIPDTVLKEKDSKLVGSIEKIKKVFFWTAIGIALGFILLLAIIIFLIIKFLI